MLRILSIHHSLALYPSNYSVLVPTYLLARSTKKKDRDAELVEEEEEEEGEETPVVNFAFLSLSRCIAHHPSIWPTSQPALGIVVY